MITRKQIKGTIEKIGVRMKPGFLRVLVTSRKVGRRIKSKTTSLNSATIRLGKELKIRIPLLLAALRKTSLAMRLSLLALLFLLVAGLWARHLYREYYGPNVTKNYLLFIRDGDKMDQVVKSLKENSCLADVETFQRYARFRDLGANVKPGAYKIQQGWSNNQLINVLRSGIQTPVMVTFNSLRTREELAGKLSRQLQSDSLSFLKLLRNDSNTIKMGFKPETLVSLFIPNSYSFYWTTTPAGFLSRMKREYDSFWNEARKQKAKAAGLSLEQVATLASIVQEESNKNDEKPVIAGVYLNRLRKNWPLQADPTIRFALGDFTIRRILTAQLTVDSPYNTYKKSGLPPGPINFPEISSLESVLNFRVHDFLFFCAKEDFSGYHNFAKTLAEHNRNAQKYQAALNKLKIFK